jgi:hypothetical protein
VRRAPGMDASCADAAQPPAATKKVVALTRCCRLFRLIFFPSRCVLVFIHLDFFRLEWMDPFYTVPHPAKIQN